MLKNNENVLGESLPIVSIIIPVYNVGIYLEKCISSCLEQTYKRCEIILVDDGCTDQCTIDILQKYRTFKEMFLIKQDNRGGVNSQRCWRQILSW
ncbi:glycosyltransferase family 2 protein [Bacteroides fragilis]|nr:glycosyltransferase family 2 protein [Bacteroides fragilis]